MHIISVKEVQFFSSKLFFTLWKKQHIYKVSTSFSFFPKEKHTQMIFFETANIFFLHKLCLLF